LQIVANKLQNIDIGLEGIGRSGGLAPHTKMFVGAKV